MPQDGPLIKVIELSPLLPLKEPKLRPARTTSLGAVYGRELGLIAKYREIARRLGIASTVEAKVEAEILTNEMQHVISAQIIGASSCSGGHAPRTLHAGFGFRPTGAGSRRDRLSLRSRYETKGVGPFKSLSPTPISSSDLKLTELFSSARRTLIFKPAAFGCAQRFAPRQFRLLISCRFPFGDAALEFAYALA